MTDLPPSGVFAFEEIGVELDLIPLAAHRALDVAGRHLSLAAWRNLPIEKRRILLDQGRGEVDQKAVQAVTDGAEPPAEPVAGDDEGRLEAPPAALREVEPTLQDIGRWLQLGKLERFALCHLSSKRATTLTSALDEIVGPRFLTHLSAQGEARMVDVGNKPKTHRRAVASATVRMKPTTARMALDHSGPKGDVLATARLAGIMAAKRTPDLIPLCHPISLSRVAVHLDVDVDRGEIHIKSATEARDRTGVEMEAMVAASVAALTIYDMLKAVDRGMAVEEVVLLEKSGGRSGLYRRDPGAKP